MPIHRIISGGQTGAERGGLEAALYCNIPHGGWCPKGRKAEDGMIPAKYLLQEMPSANYLARTEANVVDSDATVIFTMGALEGGTLKTAQFSKKHGKPCLHVDLAKLKREATVQAVVDWLKSCPDTCVLNVTGSRGSKAPSLFSAAMIRMVDIISKTNGKSVYILPDDYDPSKSEGHNPDDFIENEVTEEEHKKIIDNILAERRGVFAPRTIKGAAKIYLNEMGSWGRRQVRGIIDRKTFIEKHAGTGEYFFKVLIEWNINQVYLMVDYQKGCNSRKWEGIASPAKVYGAIIGEVWDEIHENS